MSCKVNTIQTLSQIKQLIFLLNDEYQVTNIKFKVE